MLFLTGAAIGLLVLVLILWSVVRYRRPKPDDPSGRPEPPQFRDNIRLEAFYTAVPLVIVAVLFGLTLRTQDKVTHLAPHADLTIDVTSFQWGWQFRYAGSGISVTGDSNNRPTLVLPEGRTVRFKLASPDVIHSFYVPEFLVKRDVVPGLDNTIDVRPTRTGRFTGECAEFCGLDHARMTFTVEVMTGTDFNAWVAARPGGTAAAR